MLNYLVSTTYFSMSIRIVDHLQNISAFKNFLYPMMLNEYGCTFHLCPVESFTNYLVEKALEGAGASDQRAVALEALERLGLPPR